jgi:amidase
MTINPNVVQAVPKTLASRVARPSLAGCPTVTVPAGFEPAGLPSGIQFIRRSRHDFEVLQLAYAEEHCSQAALSTLPPARQG